MTEKKADDNTFKDEVVIHEVGGESSYSSLIKTNYSDWALMMKVKLKAWALWSVIEDDDTDQEEEMITFDALCGVVPPEMVSVIVRKDTTKEASDTIATMRVDNNRVKKSMAQQLCQSSTSPTSTTVRPSRTRAT
jgi:hypothetical protein